MPIKNTLGSLKSLSLNQAYVPPDNYWILRWSSDILDPVGGFKGFFDPEGYLWLIWSGSTMFYLKINVYGEFNDGETVVLPTIGNVSTDYTGPWYAAAYNNKPVSVWKCVNTSQTSTPFGPITTTSYSSYLQFSNGDGIGITPNTETSNFTPSAADSNIDGITVAYKYFSTGSSYKFGSIIDRYDYLNNRLFRINYQISTTSTSNNLNVNCVKTLSNGTTYAGTSITIGTTGGYENYGVLFKISSSGMTELAKQYVYNGQALYIQKISYDATYDHLYMLCTSPAGDSYIVWAYADTLQVINCYLISGMGSITIFNHHFISDGNKIAIGGVTTGYTDSQIQIFGGNLFDIISDEYESLYYIFGNAVIRGPLDGEILGTGTYEVDNVSITFTSISDVTVSSVSGATATDFTSYGNYSASTTETSNSSSITDTEFTISKNSWNS